MEYMDKCRHHPDRDACVLCQKMEVAYCQECLDNCKACTDPCLYCKFRPGCVIWELCRKEARKRCKENEGESGNKANRFQNQIGGTGVSPVLCGAQKPPRNGGQCPPLSDLLAAGS